MADEILINPGPMQEEIDSYRTSFAPLKDSAAEAATKAEQPSSITKYIEALEKITETQVAFSALSENEAKSLEYIRAEFMNMDASLAQQTLWNHVTE